MLSVTAVVIVHRWAVRYGRLVGLGIALLLGTSSCFMFFAAAGMETALFVALLVTAWCLLDAGKPVLLGIVLWLIFLTRPDGAIFIIAVFIWLLLKNRSIPWKTAGVAAGLFLCWCVFSWSYYGSIIPNTVYAKSVIGTVNLPSFTSRAFRLILIPALSISANSYSGLLAPLKIIYFLLIVAGGLSFLFAMVRGRIESGLAAVLFLLLFVPVMLLADAPHQFGWYWSGPWTIALLLLPSGLMTLRRLGKISLQV